MVAFTALLILNGILLLGFRVSAVTFPSDIQALTQFKNSVDKSSIVPTSCLGSWDFSADPCDSRSTNQFVCGIRCDTKTGGESRVTNIALDAVGYKGFLHPSIGNLTELIELDVSRNAFNGVIPDTIGQLMKLTRLDLSRNYFSGSLTVSIKNIVNLELLSVSKNQLRGSIPSSLNGLSNLRRLDLSYNIFSGEIPALGGLKNLYSLDASYNRLQGKLPAQFPPLLSQLTLKGNMLSGRLPGSLNLLKGLGVLDLASNSFRGRVESYLFGHPSLQQLNLSNNSFAAISVPNLSGKTTQLVAVDISFNRIRGTLPATFASIESLAALYLRHNSFQGPIPIEYGMKANASSPKTRPLSRLFLEGNYLSGDIPAVFLSILPGKISGSFANNCLRRCPSSISLCQGAQKPSSACRRVNGRHNRS